MIVGFLILLNSILLVIWGFNHHIMIDQYKAFSIEIVNDTIYTIGSVDNTQSYKVEYGNGDHLNSMNRIGIRVFEENYEISSAIICADGGGTTVHATSQIIKNDVIYMLRSTIIFS